MTRVKRSVAARKKRRTILSEAKGYRGQRRIGYKKAKEQVQRSWAYAYRDRRTRRRELRRLWIVRINAASRREGLSYSRLMAGMRKAEIELDRKTLADLAVTDPQAFGAVAARARDALAA